jgi:predicted membrane protein
MKASDSSLNGDRLFGPYVTSSWDGESMLGKPHIVTFRLKVTSNLSTSDVVCIDVAYDAGSVLKSMRIKASDFTSSNSWQDFQLTFTVPSSLIYGLEFRVQNLNNGITDLFVDYIQVKKAWNTTTKYAEAAMNKPQSGGSWFSVSDALSWSGIVMKASDSSLNGDRLFGPYVTSSWDGESMLGKPYIVTFRLKVTSNLSTSDVVCIDVAYDAGSVLKSMRIKASDFISSNSWQDFQLTFTVPSSLIYGLEFRVQNLNNGITDLFVDQITVTAVATEH